MSRPEKTGAEVMLPCVQEWTDTSEVEFLNIEENMFGQDVMTYRCPRCSEVHKSLVTARR